MKKFWNMNMNDGLTFAETSLLPCCICVIERVRQIG